MEEVASLGLQGLPQGGKSPAVERVGPQEELLPPQGDDPGARPPFREGGVPTGPLLGLLEEEALEAKEGGDLEVVGAAGWGDLGEERRDPEERSLGMPSADEEGTAVGQGLADRTDPSPERLRDLEFPVARRAAGGRRGEVAR